MKLEYCTELPEQIVCIDTGYGREKLDAAYLLRAGERAGFIDAGTHRCVPRFLHALDHYGIWIMPVAPESSCVCCRKRVWSRIRVPHGT